MVLGNPHQLIRLFTNLVANAATYTDAGGTISLRISGKDKNRNCLHVHRSPR
jgi:signal transduction histidine kinase